MDTILPTKAVTLTELGEPGKVLDQAAGSPVAILDRNVVVAYLVPVEAVGRMYRTAPDDRDVSAVLAKRRAAIQPVLDYLRHK